MYQFTPRITFNRVLEGNSPAAMAWVTGNGWAAGMGSPAAVMSSPAAAMNGQAATGSGSQSAADVNSSAAQLSGLVKFFPTPYGGTLVEAEVFGLPNISEPLSTNYYAMHIHENGDCSQGFSRTGDHYNPTMQLHPDHVGDMPPLLANQGYAWISFYDKRFTPEELIGKSVVIHMHPDDFMSQPAGNSGEKIGCGVIMAAE